MPFEKNWAGVGATVEVWDDMYYERGFNDFSPLLAAALVLDEVAIARVLSRYHGHACDLFYRALRSIEEYGCGYLQFYSEYFHSKKAPELDTVKYFLLSLAQSLNVELHYKYNKRDLKMLDELLAQKIEKVNSINELIEFYSVHVTDEHLSYRSFWHRVLDSLRSLFSSRTFYSASKIHFIEKCQTEALWLVQNVKSRLLGPASTLVLASDIFSSEHYQQGVTTDCIREAMERLSKNFDSEKAKPHNLMIEAHGQSSVDRLPQLYPSPIHYDGVGRESTVKDVPVSTDYLDEFKTVSPTDDYYGYNDEYKWKK